MEKGSKKTESSVFKSPLSGRPISGLPELEGAPSSGTSGFSSSSPSDAIISDLPFSYNTTTLVLLPRDPWWAFAYWDFSSETWQEIVAFRKRDYAARARLRFRDEVSGDVRETDVFLEARNWYVHINSPGSDVEAELGLSDAAGKFRVLTRSNRIHMPVAFPSGAVSACPDSPDLTDGGGAPGASPGSSWYRP